MSTIDWTPVFPVLIALGAGACGYFIKGNHEKKKVRNLVLYNLLEIYSQILKLDSSRFESLLKDKILAHAHEKDKAEILNGFNEFFEYFYLQFIEATVLEELEGMQKKYSTSVYKLASFDPITAFKLTNKNAVIKVFDFLENLIEQDKEEASEQAPDEELSQQAKATLRIIKPAIIQQAVKDLESEIKKIAKSISILKYWKFSKAIAVFNDHWDSEFNASLEEYFKKVMPQVIESLKEKQS